MDAYGSSDKAKEYFEFFLAPDADVLLEKKVDIIAKEINRSKWGRSRARISAIRKELKDFAAFNVGVEYECRLTLYTFRMLAGTERYVNYSTPLENGTAALGRRYLEIANSTGSLEQAIQTLENSIAELCSARMATLTREQVNSYLAELKIQFQKPNAK